MKIWMVQSHIFFFFFFGWEIKKDKWCKTHMSYVTFNENIKLYWNNIAGHASLNGSQLAKMKKYIPYMFLP